MATKRTAVKRTARAKALPLTTTNLSPTALYDTSVTLHVDNVRDASMAYVSISEKALNVMMKMLALTMTFAGEECAKENLLTALNANPAMRKKVAWTMAC